MAESFTTCRCCHCGGKIEFDSSQLEGDESRTINCPHCQLETEAFIPTAKKESVLSEILKSPGVILRYYSKPELATKVSEKQIICPNPNCGYKGVPKEEGHGIAAIILCLLFLPLGIIYFFVMGGKCACPRCGTRTQIAPNP